MDKSSEVLSQRHYYIIGLHFRILKCRLGTNLSSTITMSDLKKRLRRASKYPVLNVAKFGSYHRRHAQPSTIC